MSRRRRQMLGEGKEGPTLIDPPKPAPYYSCSLCNYFEREMACTGGLRGSPTYYKTCIHPDMHTNISKGRSLDEGRLYTGSSAMSKDVTPEWCPLLKDTKPDDGTQT